MSGAQALYDGLNTEVKYWELGLDFVQISK